MVMLYEDQWGRTWTGSNEVELGRTGSNGVNWVEPKKKYAWSGSTRFDPVRPGSEK